MHAASDDLNVRLQRWHREIHAADGVYHRRMVPAKQPAGAALRKPDIGHEQERCDVPGQYDPRKTATAGDLVKRNAGVVRDRIEDSHW